MRSAVLETFGAVSRPSRRADGGGALHASGADLAVAVTGIAGPDGGSADKPVGLVWFALAQRGGTAEPRSSASPAIARRSGAPRSRPHCGC